MPLEGLQLGNYRLLHLIGSGGMGEVYLAEDTRIHRQVAIKVIRTEASPYPDANATKEAIRLFQREMRAITTLDHPHVLPLYDFGEETLNKAVLTYMVMPYRTEGSLADWLQQRSRSEMLSLQIIAHFIDQAADALQHAHDHQLIHQDVKPSNFLIRNRATHPNHPDLLLADFGIAKFMMATATASQSVRGTPAFMAPEQWDGHPVAATDQYALAVMTYLLLTGHPPFQGGPGQVMRQHFMAQPQPTSTLNPRISPALDAVILRALAKQPEDRFPSIMAFAQAFQQALHGGDLRATLAISEPEALSGTSRILTLPGGQQVTVTVPAGAQDGQIIRLEGQGEPYYDGGPPGALILSIAIASPEEPTPTPDTSSDQTIISTNPKSNSSSTKGVASSSDSKSEGHVDSSDHKPDSNVEAIAPAKPFSSNAKASTATPKSRSTKSANLLALPIILIFLLIVSSVILLSRAATDRANTSATATAQQAYDYATATALVQQAYAHATATSLAFIATDTAANPNPYPPYRGALVLDDPLHDNTKGYRWSEYSNCRFIDGGYHANSSRGYTFYGCYANYTTSFSNFTLQVQVTIIKGDCGGILFRANGVKLYYFEVCLGGSYRLSRYLDTTKANALILQSGPNSNIYAGPNQTNLVAVTANGSSIDLYVNQHLIMNVSDSAYSNGQIAVFAEDYNHSTEVVFSNVKVWTF